MYSFVDEAGGISLPEFSYFGVQAYWGATRHFGGLSATEELAEVCHINKDTYVLEVGCGIGLTASYLAKRYGCRVAGVDLSEQMIDLCRKRARREGVADRLEFRTADAQLLPFKDGLFDVVICESVTAFLNDPQKGVREYVRVAKLGGYVGLNEGTWIRTPPPTELVEFIDRTMANATFLTSDEWRELMGNAGLTDIEARKYTLTALRQLINEIRGLGCKDLVRASGRFCSLYIKSPAFRKYAKEITPSRTIIKSLFAYLGFGIYVGRKRLTYSQKTRTKTVLKSATLWIKTETFIRESSLLKNSLTMILKKKPTGRKISPRETSKTEIRDNGYC